MAKTSYLVLTNKVLGRIYENDISDVTAASGKGLMITRLLNEAQEMLYGKPVDWYTLFSTDTITTVASTATYAYPTDLGHTIDIINNSSNWILSEDNTRGIDGADPDGDTTGAPTHFSVEGANYRLYPIPAGVETLTVKYYSRPVAMTVNASTIDLPQDCENVIVEWVLVRMYKYLNKFELATDSKVEYKELLEDAISSNNRVLDKLFRFQANTVADGIIPPRFPGEYGLRGRY